MLNCVSIFPEKKKKNKKQRAMIRNPEPSKFRFNLVPKDVRQIGDGLNSGSAIKLENYLHVTL